MPYFTRFYEMEKKAISEHVLVGKLIGNHLKKQGFSGAIRVNGKGGTSVDVFLTDLSPRQVQDVTLFCNQYKAGNINSSNDCYEFHQEKSGPTVHFISIKNQFSDEKRQQAFDALRSKIYPDEMAHLPANLKHNDPFAMIADDDTLDQLIYRSLVGYFEDECEAVWGKDGVKRKVEVYMINDKSEIEIIEELEAELSFSPIAALGFHQPSQRLC